MFFYCKCDKAISYYIGDVQCGCYGGTAPPWTPPKITYHFYPFICLKLKHIPPRVGPKNV